MVKKPFFKERTIAQIRKANLVEISTTSDISQLSTNEFAIIDPFFPGDAESARKHMKHGPEVLPRRQYTKTQAINERLTPIQLRAEVFDSLNGPCYSCYSIHPLGQDKRKRKISLVECLEGARIYAYANQVQGVEINIKPYADAKRVATDGAEIMVEVPSRTSNHKRLKFKLINIPIVDSPAKFAITPNIGSTHSCPAKTYKIRYPYESSKETSQVFNICAHEIAGFLKIIEHYWNNEKNIVPLQMCQFAIPTQKAVDFYLKLCNNILIKDPKLKSKHKLRKLRIADKEIALWKLTQNLGHDKTFYSKKSRDGDIADYNWEVK